MSSVVNTVCIIKLFYRFSRLSEEKFPKDTWPEAEHIAPVVGNGKRINNIAKQKNFK